MAKVRSLSPSLKLNEEQDEMPAPLMKNSQGEESRPPLEPQSRPT